MKPRDAFNRRVKGNELQMPLTIGAANIPLARESRAKPLGKMTNAIEGKEKSAKVVEKSAGITASHRTMPGGSCMVALLYA